MPRFKRHTRPYRALLSSSAARPYPAGAFYIADFFHIV
jgi:hypothetical protein